MLEHSLCSVGLDVPVLSEYNVCLYPAATTEIYSYCHTLSRHDALPISASKCPLAKGSLSAAALTVAILPISRWAASLTTAAIISLDRSLAMTSARSEEHTSELQSLMRISYAAFCLKKKKQ